MKSHYSLGFGLTNISDEIGTLEFGIPGPSLDPTPYSFGP